MNTAARHHLTLFLLDSFTAIKLCNYLVLLDMKVIQFKQSTARYLISKIANRNGDSVAILIIYIYFTELFVALLMHWWVFMNVKWRNLRLILFWTGRLVLVRPRVECSLYSAHPNNNWMMNGQRKSLTGHLLWLRIPGKVIPVNMIDRLTRYGTKICTQFSTCDLVCTLHTSLLFSYGQNKFYHG